MLDFDMNLISVMSPVTVTVEDVAPVVIETVQVVSPVSQEIAFLMKPEDTWGWGDLRDYVIAEIEKRHGPQVRDLRKESGIFKSFMSRWPEQAVSIAKVAFGPVYDGMWRNAPISVNRFCKASDVYFALPISERL